MQANNHASSGWASAFLAAAVGDGKRIVDPLAAPAVPTAMPEEEKRAAQRASALTDDNVFAGMLVKHEVTSTPSSAQQQQQRELQDYLKRQPAPALTASPTPAATTTTTGKRRKAPANSSARPKKKASKEEVEAAAAEDSDAQDTKSAKKMEKQIRKENQTFEARLRRKAPQPPKYLTEKEDGIDVAPLPETAWVRVGERVPTPVATGPYVPPPPPPPAPGEVLARVVSVMENFENLQPDQLRAVTDDLDRPLNERQGADAKLPYLHQRFYYPQDPEDDALPAERRDPSESRALRPRQGQHGTEFYGSLATTAGPSSSSSSSLEANVEQAFEYMSRRYRAKELDDSRIYDTIVRSRSVYQQEGSESIFQRKIANTEVHDRYSDDLVLRQARPGEPACLHGENCEGMRIPGTVPVINLARFTLKDMQGLPPGHRWPSNLSRPCEMCARHFDCMLYITQRAEGGYPPPNVVISTACNLADAEHQYALEQCVMNSAADPGQMMPAPRVLHVPNYYRQVQDPDGYYSWKQDGYYMPTGRVDVLAQTMSSSGF